VVTQLDELALVNDRMIQSPQPENAPFGYPQWYGTEAQQRLHEIVQSGMNEFMDLEDLRETRDDWKKFPLDIFVRRVSTEEKRHRASGYWENKKKKQEHKKKEIEDMLMQLKLDGEEEAETGSGLEPLAE
jgi:hypothetical protein